MGESPQATSCQERKQILNQLLVMAAELAHVVTILSSPIAILDTVQRLMASFIWQERHLKLPNFVYGRQENGGIGVRHSLTRI
jgi:hypothetical protein